MDEATTRRAPPRRPPARCERPHASLVLTVSVPACPPGAAVRRPRPRAARPSPRRAQPTRLQVRAASRAPRRPGRGARPGAERGPRGLKSARLGGLRGGRVAPPPRVARRVEELPFALSRAPGVAQDFPAPEPGGRLGADPPVQPVVRPAPARLGE